MHQPPSFMTALPLVSGAPSLQSFHDYLRHQAGCGQWH